MPDHVHMMISIPPKYAVSRVMGFIKGRVRSTLLVCIREGRGTLSVSISGREDILLRRVGRDERVIREYIRHQEAEDRRIDQLPLM